MNWKPPALLPLILVLAACAVDGGTRGSGITTFIQGNVASVQTAAGPRPAETTGPGIFAALRELLRVETIAHARTVVEGIRVGIEGTDVHGETDAAGRFALRGDFGQRVNLVFELPDDGGAARIAIIVPAGGTLTMNDVRIDAEAGEATADTQDVDFDGIVTETDCAALTLTMVSTEHDPDDQDWYVVRLDTSSVQDSHGNLVACEDLRAGDQGTVQGSVNPDGTFGDATIELEDTSDDR